MKRVWVGVIWIFVPRAMAQWVVNDPVNASIAVETRVETLAQLAEQIKRAEDQIKNQLQQIQQASQLLDVQSHVKASIGDWQGVIDRARSLKLTAENLQKNVNGELRSSIELDYGATALRFDQVQASASVRTTDAFGRTVTTHPDETTRFWNVEKAASHALATYEATEKEIGEINREVAQAYDRMTSAGVTQQEYEKLRGKIQTLNLRRDDLRAQRHDAAVAVELQQRLNDNRKALESATKTDVDESNHDAHVKAFTGIKLGELSWR